MADTIVIEVARYSPETDAEPHFQKYEVPLRGDWMVLDALNYIKDKLDGSLTYRWSCRMGICGSCGMVVNGARPVLHSASAGHRHNLPKSEISDFGGRQCAGR